MRKAWGAFLGVASAIAGIGCGGVVTAATQGEGGQHGKRDGGPSGAGGDGLGVDTGGVAPQSTDASLDAGLGLDIAYDGGTPMAHACERHFATIYLAPCGGPVLPRAELRRIHSLYMRSCTGLALPGVSRTAAQLEACAADLEANACQTQSGFPSSCDIRGTLVAGAPCSDDAQCASGACEKPDTCSPEGCGSGPRCGKCMPTATMGQDCHTANCELNELCDTVTQAGPGIYLCVRRTEGDTGAACDDIGELCRPGLFCDRSTNKCSLPGGPGASCGELSSIGCRLPLICEGTPGGCQNRGALGASCYVDGECASGLGCAARNCEAVTWVRPGGACDDGVRRCLVGTCPVGRSVVTGVCPEVISDGQPCDPFTKTCDTFSECINGVCAARGTVACAGP